MSLRHNNKKIKLSKNRLTTISGAIFVIVFAVIGVHILLQSHAQTPGAPTSGTAVCGQAVLNSPYSYNGSATTFTSGQYAGLPTFGSAGTDFPSATSGIIIPAGNNSAAAQAGTYQVNNAVVYFEPGVHDIENIMYTGHNSVYVGGYNSTVGEATLNGVDGATSGTGVGGSRLPSSQASSGNIVYDTWEYLTIENYTSSNGNSVMGNVNGAGTDIGDTYMYNTIGPNEYGYAGNSTPPATGQSSGGGYAIDAGSNTTIEYNCLKQNAEGAFNGGGVNITINNNEISSNGLGTYPDDAGAGKSPFSCGCSGGGKLFHSVNPTIDYNYIHDNYNAGIWLDFDNTGADMSGNYIASNWGSGIMYEASYNANISDNTLVGNGWASDGAWPPGVGGLDCYGGVSCTNGFGPTTGAGGGNAYAAIDLSDSGGNSNLNTIALSSDAGGGSTTSRYSGELLVEGNVLTNNFGGVKVYTDTNRFPDNIDNDSACSVPLGAGADGQQANSTTYYEQTKVLHGDNATVSGSTVSVSGGTATFCADYGYSIAAENDSGSANTVQQPEVGMAVFDENANTFLGTIATVTSANSFTLSGSPGNRTGASLLISAYGGCGPADYFGGGPGVASGTPSADYWDNCIYGSRNVTVSGNTFNMNAASVTGCTAVNLCGFMLNEAFLAGVPSLMHYWQNYSSLIAKASGGLGNVFSNNTYTWSSGTGTPTAWQFWAGTQGNTVTQAAWQAAPYGQDAGSTFNAAANLNPTVSITAPAASSLNHISTTITASATDNSGTGLSKVEFYANGSLLATDTTSPYSYTWDTLPLTDGSYSLTAIAYDNDGNSTTSSAVPVNINNGDANGDGTINVNDLSALATNWGKASGATYAQGDFNGDGTINGIDLSIMAKNWGD